jgi:hypothetical protein
VLAAAALAVTACSDSKGPVAPSDQTAQPDLRQAAQGASDDPLALAQTVRGFGGLFLDEQGTPTVYLQDTGQRGAAEQALGPWLRGRGLTGAQMRVLHADFAWSDLQAWHGKASPVALAIRGAVFSEADGASNRLRIGVERGSGAGGQIRSALAALGIPAAAVTVEETDPIIQMTTLQGQLRPVIAGLQINFPGFLCTLGFNATSSGTAGFVTASHCTTTQGGVENTPYYQPLQSVNGTSIATETIDPVYTTGGGCPAGRRCRRSDASFAKYINSTPNTLGSIARTSSTNRRNLTIVGNYTITADAGSSNFTLGAVVNKVGRTTGWSQGKVTASCADVNVSGSDITQLCQTIVSATVGAGDSGSDVFSIIGGTDVTLDGVLWGGSSNGKTFVFSPLANVTGELGPLTTH